MYKNYVIEEKKSIRQMTWKRDRKYIFMKFICVFVSLEYFLSLGLLRRIYYLVFRIWNI